MRALAEDTGYESLETNQRGSSLGGGCRSGREEKTGGRRERGAAEEKGVHGGTSEEEGVDEALKGLIVQAVERGRGHSRAESGVLRWSDMGTCSGLSRITGYGIAKEVQQIDMI